MNRIVCQFSCGAASAVAVKLTLAQYGSTHDVQIVNAFVAQEHKDNRRFLTDCEKWFGRPITVLRNEKYKSSTTEVFRRERFLKNQNGAPCSKLLKRRLLDSFRMPGDVIVIGFTAEEQHRLDDLRERGLEVIAPLIERGLTKPDCLAMVERAGITLPTMYLLGYNNANCIGCVKGGKGYWNKIKLDFPAEFEEIAAIEEDLGPSAYLFYDEKTGERKSLRQLKPDEGRHNILLPDCGLFCETAESEIAEVIA